jgi:thiamine kinase-like enzyme
VEIGQQAYLNWKRFGNSDMLFSRDSHRFEVLGFLQKSFPDQAWKIKLPSQGTGQEAYFARSHECFYFIKLGVQLERYQVMFTLGLSPQIITTGSLEDGTSILVQQKINGRKPSRKDFRHYLPKFAESLRQTHQSERLKRILLAKSSDRYKEAGLETLAQVEHRWEAYRSKVPASAEFVDKSLGHLKDQINQFRGGGLAASHNDVCNGNWLVSFDGKIYLLDYESMSLDDPALDLGAILWWYYPPQLRPEFLAIAGYGNDENLRNRMRIRMAVHNLNILLPREKSFDRFEASRFEAGLVDFRAVLDGKENPQGYEA